MGRHGFGAAVLLKRALQSHPEMAVSMRYQRDGSDAEFSSGEVPNDAESADDRPAATGGPSRRSARRTSGGLLEGSPLVLLLSQASRSAFSSRR